ncbi:Glutathione synthetase [Astathelohania contejeani]|uniref:Glutathione synthetase n=1 Tax=Astathelohania contejeani TaxID=164912 RepID=A0ABQ7HXF3_9MICR|nr:Glutathione synthetase [Thelohania contejeani]
MDKFDNEKLMINICDSENLMTFKNGELRSINVTVSPTNVDYGNLFEIQKDVNKLFYKSTEFIQSNKFISDIKDPLFLMLKSCVPKQRKIKVHLIRTDYLKDLNGGFKQVETNTIACAYLLMGSKLNSIHSLFYPDVLVSQALWKLPDLFCIIHSLFIKKDDKIILPLDKPLPFNNTAFPEIALMIDNDTSRKSTNYFEKVELIKLLKIRGIDMLHVTMDDVIEKCRFSEDGSDMFFLDRKVYCVYYRWFYNYEHYREVDIEIRKKIEYSNVISLPSAELQMAGCKEFNLKFSNYEALKELYGDSESISSIYNTIGEYKSIEEYKEGDETNWILKSTSEGGGNNIFGLEVKKMCLEKKRNNYFMMKKIDSMSYKNRFLGEEKERNTIPEIGIIGVLVSMNDRILINTNIGYICRSKDVNSNECGVSCGFGALDSIYK